MTSVQSEPKTEGFSSDWLTLREPADHAARNADVTQALIDHLARGQGPITLMDFGCGTGSTVRALAPRLLQALPDRQQHWVLVDADDALLDRAREAHEPVGSASVSIECRKADLAEPASVAALLDLYRPHVLTSSALIDLVSAAWLDRVAGLLAERGAALCFALNYTGRETWLPAHPLDGVILDAFNADQRRDKGFGPALGGDAAKHLASALAKNGFAVTAGTSDWHLGRADGPLIEKLATGIADAAAGNGKVTRVQADEWLKARRSAERVVVDHLDLFARPA
jgi:SAM-dependent methyltransferase